MAARTVTVACNLPNGLILQLSEFREQQMPVMGGGFRLEKVGVKVGPAVHVFGIAKPHGMEARAPIVAGYAMTHGVDADLWDEWLKQNATADYVKNRCIFAFEKPGETEHEAKENRGTLSGLQPMDMTMVSKGDRKVARDARVPRAPIPGAPELTIGPNEK